MGDEAVQDAEEYIKAMSPEELARLNQIADDLFWEKSGHKPGELLDKDDPNFDQMAGSWREFRRELATMQKQVDALPEKFRNFFRWKSGGVPLTPHNFQKLLQIAEKVKHVSDDELKDYWAKPPSLRGPRQGR